MTKLVGKYVGKFLFVAVFMAFFSGVASAESSQETVLNKYKTNGFQCLNISQTINKDTMKDFANFDALEMTDIVHVCVKTDMSQEVISGNKYVVVFDENGGMKTENQVPSYFDK